MEDHKVFLITAEQSPVDNDKFFPSWKNAVSKRTFTVGGKEYTVQSDEDYLNPYVAGVLSEAIPVKAVNKDNKTIEVQYITKNGSTVTGYWTLPVLSSGYRRNVQYGAFSFPTCAPAEYEQPASSADVSV